MRNTSIKWLVKEEGTDFLGIGNTVLIEKDTFAVDNIDAFMQTVRLIIAVTELTDFTKVKVACCWWSYVTYALLSYKMTSFH